MGRSRLLPRPGPPGAASDRRRSGAPGLAAALLGLWAAASALGAAELGEVPDAPSAFATRIDARAYEDRFATVEDVLQRVVGVRVRRYGGLGTYSTASIRGSKAEQVLVLLDGVRLNSGLRGAVDLSSLSLRSVEWIDVLRGAGSARYGSDAVGGVISITTRRPDSGPRRLDFAALTGSHRTLGADLTTSLGTEPVRAVIGYSRLGSVNDFRFERSAEGTTDGFFASLPTPVEPRRTRLGAQFMQDTGFSRFEIDVGGHSQLAGTLHLYRSDRGQPGSTLAAPIGAPDERVSCPHAEERYRRGIARLDWDHRASPRGSWRASIFHRYERSELHDPEGICGLISPSRRGRDEVQTVETQSGVELSHLGTPWRWGPLRLRSRSVISAYVDRLRGDEVDPVRRDVLNGFLQQEFGLLGGRLRLLPAVGFDLSHTDADAARDPATGLFRTLDAKDSWEWLPRLGAILQLAPGLRVKSNYARAFRRPNFNELFHPDQGFIRGNPELEPEESWNFDAGFELASDGWGLVRELRLEAAYFHRDLESSIEFIQRTAFLIEPRNVAASRVRGYEVAGSLRLTDHLELAGNYTHLDSEVRSTGNPLPHRPRNQIFASVTLLAAGSRIWAELIFEDEVALNTAGRFTADPVTQIDVGVSLGLWRLPGLGWLPEALRVSLEWVNVTDQVRIDSFGLPLPGRLFYLRLRGSRG